MNDIEKYQNTVFNLGMKGSFDHEPREFVNNCIKKLKMFKRAYDEDVKDIDDMGCFGQLKESDDINNDPDFLALSETKKEDLKSIEKIIDMLKLENKTKEDLPNVASELQCFFSGLDTILKNMFPDDFLVVFYDYDDEAEENTLKDGFIQVLFAQKNKVDEKTLNELIDNFENNLAMNYPEYC